MSYTPKKPTNTTGNDIAKALVYVGDCIIYLAEKLVKEEPDNAK